MMSTTIYDTFNPNPGPNKPANPGTNRPVHNPGTKRNIPGPVKPGSGNNGRK